MNTHLRSCRYAAGRAAGGDQRGGEGSTETAGKMAIADVFGSVDLTGESHMAANDGPLQASLASLGSRAPAEAGGRASRRRR